MTQNISKETIEALEDQIIGLISDSFGGQDGLTENGEVFANMMTIVIKSCLTKTEDHYVLDDKGEIKKDEIGAPIVEQVQSDFDSTTLNLIVKGLGAEKRANAEVHNEALKKEKKARVAEGVAGGKEYCIKRNLKCGDKIRYYNATKKCWIVATVGEQKSGIGDAKTLHVILDERDLESGKTKRDRYIHFDKLDVDFELIDSSYEEVEDLIDEGGNISGVVNL